MELARVEWFDRGWVPALWRLWQQSTAWRGRWVLVEYAGLSWRAEDSDRSARRARDFAAARLPVRDSFHEFTRQAGGTRRIDRMRGTASNG